jgi:S-adenosylmethionine-diacylglycerol 3-amino-3-carboxypropyl transferase
MSLPIQDRASFQQVRYASCWEDARLLLAAFAPLRGGRFVSIASAGDNTLALLALEPESVLAVDLSAAQLACLELRVAALRVLEREELLAFLGVSASTDRLRTYAQVRRELPLGARAFWDARLEDLERGVVFAGRFERYFALFRRFVLPLAHNRRTCDALLRHQDAQRQRAFYGDRWNTWRWRAVCHVFFSRCVMGLAGRDPEFFRHVEGAVSSRILRRVGQALGSLPAHDNPWLHIILSGQYGPTLPPWLEPELHRRARANLRALEWRLGALEEVLRDAPGGYDGFNLSDVFEYMDPALFRQVATSLLVHCRGGSRLAYWNMLVPRCLADELPDRVHTVQPLSDELAARDRAFFYSRFYVDEVSR